MPLILGVVLAVRCHAGRIWASPGRDAAQKCTQTASTVLALPSKSSAGSALRHEAIEPH